jgi:hypothetical protein
MLTAGLNSLALVRFGGFRFSHGGGAGGFAFLLIGLAAVAIGFWVISRKDESAPAKN